MFEVSISGILLFSIIVALAGLAYITTLNVLFNIYDNKIGIRKSIFFNWWYQTLLRSLYRKECMLNGYADTLSEILTLMEGYHKEINSKLNVAIINSEYNYYSGRYTLLGLAMEAEYAINGGKEIVSQIEYESRHCDAAYRIVAVERNVMRKFEVTKNKIITIKLKLETSISQLEDRYFHEVMSI